MIDSQAGGQTIDAALAATVWQIRCKPGYVIQTAEDVMVVLEAMKTEVPIQAGEDNVGRKVVAFGTGVREGAAVRGGDVLVILE